MSHAEVCPVCRGSGKAGLTDSPCHGCNGTGRVTIQDSPPQPIVFPQFPPTTADPSPYRWPPEVICCGEPGGKYTFNTGQS